MAIIICVFILLLPIAHMEIRSHIKSFETMFYDDIAKPQTKYAQIPCRLTYELDGEIKVIEDVIVCEFTGSVNGEGKKERSWKAYLKSGKDDLVLLELDERHKENGRIIFDYGNAAYYMGDKETSPFAPQSLNSVAFLEKEIVGNRITHRLKWHSAEEAFEEYAIKLIDFEYELPIENEFVLKK